MQDTSCLVLPIPDHAFFEQTVFQSQISNDFLECGRFRAQLLDLRRCRLAGSIPRKALLARFEEFLRPSVIQALADAFPATQRGDTLLAAQTSQHDPDLLFRRIMLARLALDPFDQLVSRA